MNLRWGLIGYGKRVAAALREAPGSQLDGLWGRQPERTAAFAGEHAIPNAHRSLEALVGSEIDAIYVCTPPDSAIVMERMGGGDLLQILAQHSRRSRRFCKCAAR